MIKALRTVWMIGLAVIFFLGTSACGQKHLSVSTSSGKGNQQEELEAALPGTPSEQTRIPESSLTETGLGGASASQSTIGQDTAMVVEPPPLPTIRGVNGKESSETADASNSAGSHEGFQPQSSSGAAAAIQAPATIQTAMDPRLDPSQSGNGVEHASSGDGAAFVPIDSPDTDQATQFQGASSAEESGSLVQSTPEEAESIERFPENIVVAKVEPSDTMEEQLARIREDELATAAAGLQDIFFEFDSWRITEEGKEMLEKNANLLQGDSEVNLLIEGHCDQRGTQAYNIVLGKKRAIAIRDYLVQLGVEPSRLSVVTYGKEKPFCTDATEICYRENRRGHFLKQ